MSRPASGAAAGRRWRAARDGPGERLFDPVTGALLDARSMVRPG